MNGVIDVLEDVTADDRIGPAVLDRDVLGDTRAVVDLQPAAVRVLPRGGQ